MLWRGTLACSGLEESSLTLFDRWIRRRLPLPSTTPTSREIRPPCGTLSCSTRQGWAKPTAQIQQVLLMHVMTYMYCSSIYTICWIKISLSPGQLKCLCIAEIIARKNFTNTSTSRWRKFHLFSIGWLTHGSVILWQLHPGGSCGWASLQHIDISMKALVVHTLHRTNQTPLGGGVTTLSTEHLHMEASLHQEWTYNIF